MALTGVDEPGVARGGRATRNSGDGQSEGVWSPRGALALGHHGFLALELMAPHPAAPWELAQCGSWPGAPLPTPVPGSDSLRVRGRGTGQLWQIPASRPSPSRVSTFLWGPPLPIPHPAMRRRRKRLDDSLPRPPGAREAGPESVGDSREEEQRVSSQDPPLCPPPPPPAAQRPGAKHWAAGLPWVPGALAGGTQPGGRSPGVGVMPATQVGCGLWGTGERLLPGSTCARGGQLGTGQPGPSGCTPRSSLGTRALPLGRARGGGAHPAVWL